MSEVVDRGSRPNRLWLVALVLLLAGAGVWYSAQRRAAIRADVVAIGGGRPQLLNFGLGLCDQCKRMKPVMERAARELAACVDVHVLDIRNEANEQLAERYKMRAIPLVLLVDGAGKELWRKEGFVDFPELSQAVAKELGWTANRPCQKAHP